MGSKSPLAYIGTFLSNSHPDILTIPWLFSPSKIYKGRLHKREGASPPYSPLVQQLVTETVPVSDKETLIVNSSILLEDAWCFFHVYYNAKALKHMF